MADQDIFTPWLAHLASSYVWHHLETCQVICLLCAAYLASVREVQVPLRNQGEWLEAFSHCLKNSVCPPSSCVSGCSKLPPWWLFHWPLLWLRPAQSQWSSHLVYRKAPDIWADPLHKGKPLLFLLLLVCLWEPCIQPSSDTGWQLKQSYHMVISQLLSFCLCSKNFSSSCLFHRVCIYVLALEVGPV